MTSRAFLLVFFVSAWSAASPAAAQQNLFNVPSGQITPDGTVFTQQQVNLDGTSEIAAKSHFVYGLGGGWEVGLNALNFYFDTGGGKVVDFEYDENEYPLRPKLVLTGQKAWAVGKDFALNVGTQAGTNLSQRSGDKRATHFTYALAVWEPFYHARFLAGPYLSDERFLGPGPKGGVVAGFEVPVYGDSLYAMGDVTSGTHVQGNSVIGGMYRFRPGLEVCAGALVPNPGSSERGALVLELNLYGF